MYFPDPFYLARVLSLKDADNEGDSNKRIRVVWFSQLQHRSTIKSIGSAMWSEAWNVTKSSTSTAWIERKNIHQVVPQDLIFTSRKAIRRQFITSFYRGLQKHITAGHVNLKAPSDNLYWWNEYQKVLQQVRHQESKEAAQYISDVELSEAESSI